VGRKLGERSSPGDIILLCGGLGAGKTCLAQGILWGLGIEGFALSPSFVIIREYQGRIPLYHIDLYRLGTEEVEDIGIEDYLYGEGVCVVEWADRGEAIFPPENLLINLSIVSETSRLLEFKPRGSHYQRLVQGLWNFL
jgi:tRNA threonylcarbamoyladenosine biosynthesis protein TsaE